MIVGGYVKTNRERERYSVWVYLLLFGTRILRESDYVVTRIRLCCWLFGSRILREQLESDCSLQFASLDFSGNDIYLKKTRRGRMKPLDWHESDWLMCSSLTDVKPTVSIRYSCK
jgi:hypothetical protein